MCEECRKLEDATEKLSVEVACWSRVRPKEWPRELPKSYRELRKSGVSDLIQALQGVELSLVEVTFVHRQRVACKSDIDSTLRAAEAAKAYAEKILSGIQSIFKTEVLPSLGFVFGVTALFYNLMSMILQLVSDPDSIKIFKAIEFAFCLIFGGIMLNWVSKEDIAISPPWFYLKVNVK